jgi:GNAT superfamily N-acetyltransferase
VIDGLPMPEGQIVNAHQTFCTQIRATSRTTLARFNLSWEEIAHLADRHTRAVQNWLSSRSPQGARFDGLGVSATSTGITVPLLNLAHSSRFPPGTDGLVIDAEIEAIRSFFVQRGVGHTFTWWLSPLAQPPNMGQYLVRHGFQPREYRLPTMVAPLSSSAGWPDINPQAQVWQAASRLDLEAASLIRRTAFRFQETTALTYFEDMATDWLRGDPARLYVARADDDGPPVAMGALIVGDGLPGVYVMATLPVAQRQGLGKAILARILSEAAAEGHQLIVLTAGPQAYSLYRKFGFEHIFEYTLYHLEDGSLRSSKSCQVVT